MSQVNFRPENPAIENPQLPGSSAHARHITVKLLPYDTRGHKILPSRHNPLQVEIFGAPDGVITPTMATITSGRPFTFRYSGAYLPNDLLLEAWIKNPKPSQTLGVYSIGTTLILRANRQSPGECSYQAASFAMSTDCASGTVPGSCSNMTDPKGIRISAAIGSLPPGAPISNFEQYTVDTGSLGILVPRGEIPALGTPSPGEGQIIGPGGPGLKYYDSNGGACYQGNYWLAPVTFALSNNGSTATNTVTTHPIKILAVPDDSPLHYMGVGFDRNSTSSGDYFDSPADNAFLNLTDAASGADVSPGYTITPTQITLGVTSSAGFDLTPLQADQCVAGDYLTAPGCFSFPALSPQGSFCGTMLMDTGIGDMYLNMGSNSWPQGYCVGGLVPDDTTVQINSGSSISSKTCYQFNVDNEAPTPAPTPISPGPSTTNCIVNKTDQSIMFINTGRHPLSWFTYMYDDACGQVGFAPNAQYQPTCP